ncbi:hypothetical protein BX666DRAFT_1125855 [Dichotomocladium elegans]|nr:hypothetical protein BX666DRAFT_1125855 [Dichotomocladium elegans]
MKHSYADVLDHEKAILDRQFDGTLFAKETPHRRPTKLAIFDFDSTLFYSPLLSPSIWHPTLVHAVTNEGQLGPGWWRDIRSLELGADVENSRWDGFWNPEVVRQARECIADESTLTVVLTGRRVHPFFDKVSAMLASQNLRFDMTCLRPDPENPEVDNQSVFASTMEFKLAFILHLLHRVPSLSTVTMWDDRPHHVKKFQLFLDTLKYEQHLLTACHVHQVRPIRPVFNPDWERETVQKIIENSSYVLTPKAAATVITLENKSRDILRRMFPEFRTPRNHTGEVPVFSGTEVFLALKPLSRMAVPFGGIGCTVQIRVTDISEQPHRGIYLKGMALDEALRTLGASGQNPVLLPARH